MRALNLSSTYGVIVHRNFIPLYVDDNYARIFGYESAQALLDSIDTLLELIAPEDWATAIKTNQKLLEGKVEATTRTHTNINAKGEVLTVLTLDQVVEWEGAPALKITVVDLTMIEKANQKIIENERQYRELVTKSKQGILIHREFTPLIVNDAWVKLYKADSVEAVIANGCMLERIPEEVRSLALSRNRQLMNGEIEGGSIQVENICFDGSVRVLHLYENRIEWDGEYAVQTVVEDVTEKAQLEKELQHKASHDQLTDLYNRDAIYEWLSGATESLESLACFIIDIDNFKRINDTYGHYAGDKVIKSFAYMCESLVDDKGIVGRWGGEEFLVLLPDQDYETCIGIAEKIRANCESKTCRFGDINIKSTVSIGVSYDAFPKANNQFNVLLSEADAKMYQAKRSGKNQVVS